MKNAHPLRSTLRFIVPACATVFISALPAYAGDSVVNVTPVMQACNSTADCTVAGGQCGNSCSSVPLNIQSAAAFEKQKAAMCGESSGNVPGCTTVPALTPACIHNRCTIGIAYQEHADARDYGASKALRNKAFNYSTLPPGIKPQDIAPAAGGDGVEPQAPQTTNAHKSTGFTAYDLPDKGIGTMQRLGTLPE